MPLKNVSAQVTVTAPSTYAWQVTNNTCGSAPVFSGAMSGILNAGTTTLSQTISFPEDCEVSVCLVVTEDDCVDSTCFNLVENTIHTEYSWACSHTTEQQFECVYVENASGGFSTEEECESCRDSQMCPTCNGTPCNDYVLNATYNCTTGISLNWVGPVYNGIIECLYLTVNIATQPCTDNILAQNINGTQINTVTGMFPNGTYSVGVSAQLENGCIISSNPIVIDCLGTIEWNLECCQTIDTSGIMAGYQDKYYVLDITNNDLSQPIYADFSFFQVADRLKFYDYSEVVFTNGIPSNLNSLTTVADTDYVGKQLSCYPPLLTPYYGFVEKEDNDPPSAQGQSDTVMQSLSPSWSLLFPCNNNYTQSYTTQLYCPQCTYYNSVYIIPKNCANAPNVPDCEPVDIIGCGRLTISPTALATIGTVTTGSPVSNRKKLFIHLESNDCNTGCTAAVFKILCPGCYGCTIDCDVTYSCNNGLNFDECEDYTVQKCTFDAQGNEICIPAVQGEFLANGTYYIKVINYNIDNCFESTPIQVNCPTCTTPQIRSITSGCTDGDNKGYLHAAFTTTHTTAYVHLGVLIQGDYVPGMYHNKYVGYDCTAFGCAGYVQMQGTGIISGGYYWYQSVSFVPINSTLSLVFLFDDTAGTFTDLVNTDYKVKITDGACSTEYPKVGVNCPACTTPQIRSVTSRCANNETKGYVHAAFSTTHTTAYVYFGVSISDDYVPGMYHNKYVGYDCNAFGCAGYVQIQATGIISNGYHWYQSVAFVPINSTLTLLFLFDDTAGTFTGLVNTNYKVKVTDGECSTEYPKVAVHCIDCSLCEDNLADYHFQNIVSTLDNMLWDSTIRSTVNITNDFLNININSPVLGTASLDFSNTSSSTPFYFINSTVPTSPDISTLSVGYHPLSYVILPTLNSSTPVPSNLSLSVQTYLYNGGVDATLYNSLFRIFDFEFDCGVDTESMSITGLLQLNSLLPLTTYISGDLTVTQNDNAGTIGTVTGDTEFTYIPFTAGGIRNDTNTLTVSFKSSYSGSAGIPAYTDLIQTYTLTYTINC